MNLAALNAVLNGDIENSVIASTPGGIERQEAQGQAELVANAMLPKQISGATREQLVEIGFKFGEEIDEIFVQCELPVGWEKIGTGHSMHSDLIDDKGRVRAGIFYKAAFYDRRADMHMRRRFNIDPYFGIDKDTEVGLRCVVTDVKEVVFDAGPWARSDYDNLSKLEKQCREWLFTAQPEWENPLAYW